MARVLFTTLGSYGDLYPYLAVGAAVQRLGHTAIIASSASYREKVESQGLAFAPIRPDMSLDNREMMKYLFHQRLGTERVLREVANRTRETYEDSVPAVNEADIIVTHPLSFGPLIAAQKAGMPWISSVLAPMSFISAWDPPVPAPFPALVRLRALGPGVMRAVWNIGKRASMSWVKPVLQLRRELGLPSTGHPLFEGAHSPDLVLALFSRYFAETQPDWPPQTRVTGFPLFNSGSVTLPAELDAFFNRGPAPIVFTLGSSAVGAAGRFYADSLQATLRLKARAVFLTGSHPQGLPEPLPDTALAWPYAPHEPVFARAAAIVHQGGIGTTAQALTSGHPALVVPFAHDQFDNAERVRRLGAGLSLPRSKYNAKTAEVALGRLLHEASHAEAAARLGSMLRSENGAETAAHAIDSFLRSKRI